MVDYRLEWILLVSEKNKFTLKGTNDDTIRLPVEYIQAMGWELGKDIRISNAWWDGTQTGSKCFKIQIELTEKPKKKGRWAK